MTVQLAIVKDELPVREMSPVASTAMEEESDERCNANVDDDDDMENDCK